MFQGEWLEAGQDPDLSPTLFLVEQARTPSWPRTSIARTNSRSWSRVAARSAPTPCRPTLAAATSSWRDPRPFTRLEAALKAVDFNPLVDRLFGVGDLVDRGPESANVLEWLRRPWFIPVKGNHEDFAIRWPKGNMDPAIYVANGGGWNVGATTHEQRLMAWALYQLPIAIELETSDGVVGIVHAECPCKSWAEFAMLMDRDSRISDKEREHLEMLAMWKTAGDLWPFQWLCGSRNP